MISGSLEVKLPTIWTDERAKVKRVRGEKNEKGEGSDRKDQKQEDASVGKGKGIAKHRVFFDILLLRRADKLDA